MSSAEDSYRDLYKGISAAFFSIIAITVVCVMHAGKMASLERRIGDLKESGEYKEERSRQLIEQGNILWKRVELLENQGEQ